MKPSDIIKKKYFEMRGTHGDDSDMMFTAIFEYLDEQYLKKHNHPIDNNGNQLKCNEC